MKEFLLFSSIIYGSLAVGWVIRRVFPALEHRSRLISSITVMAVETPLILTVFWGMDGALLRAYWPVALAPIFVLSVSGAVGYVASRRLVASKNSRGALVVSSMFSNVGTTMGGFLCLLYLGDRGLVVSQLYLLSSIPYYFTAVFTVARGFAGGERRTVWQAFKANFSDPIAALPLTGMAIGLSLGLAGVPLPTALEVPRRVLVFAAVIMFALSFGLTAQVRLMIKRIRDYLVILPVKFVVAPLAGLAFVLIAGYSLASNPLAFKVVIIQSMMPVAIWSVVAAKLFRLDDQLALGAWIFSTICLSPLVPLIGWIAGL